LNAPLNRYGGNASSRYNWQANGDNRGQDWYFESLGDASAIPGERGDTFVTTSRSGGAQPMLTVPMLDWIAKLGANRGKLASYSIAKYGAQTGNDWQWYADAGNGVQSGTNAAITWNDPNDANTPNSAPLQQGWVQHVVNTFGAAAAGGVKYYLLDNEHSIWHQTHRDVHNTGATMDEIKSKMIAYASAIKAVDPGALVFGPEEWGWSGYFYSGYDQQYGAAHNWCCFPDKQAHGNWDYLPWLLDQLRQYEAANGKRLLDVFSVHYYPQGGEFGNDTSSAMQLTRNRSTRALWDPNYVDPTWINSTVMLIPRLKQWVASYYPGLKTAITEYNWGAEGHINGATTQADIEGIFGREGLDYATRWTTPDPSTPTYKAMKLYRNYDGNRSTFGETSVSASVPDPDTLSAFAAQRSSDGAMTVMVISKVLSGTTPVTLSFSSFTPKGVAQAWQLTSANAIARLSDQSFTGSSFSTSVPAQSVTLFVVPVADPIPNQPPVASISANPGSGTAPLTVSFSGSASKDADGSIVAYAWNFGDGASSAGVTTSHTYAGPGTYTATLTVTDNLGATGSASIAITASSGAGGGINAPSNLTAARAGGGGVNLAWADRSSDETGFYVERAPAGSTSFARIGQVPANVTSFFDTPGPGRFTYRVQAFISSTGQASAYSNQATIRVK
jgi:PKD repeat protein